MAAIAVAALLLGASGLTGLVQREAFAHTCEQDGCVEEGWMTGGGRIDTDIILTHGFVLRCDPDAGRNNLEVNWDRGNKFHLTDVNDVNCFDDPTMNPAPPKAGFDTLEMSGSGRYNGEDGAFIWVQFTDYGEPGKNDWSTIVIYDAEGNLILDVTGKLRVGNHQAHSGGAK